MVRYSVIVPGREVAEMFARRLGELYEVLGSLGAPFEILCVDDCSSAATTGALRSLLTDHDDLRVIQLDRPGGLDAALSAGIAAAAGDVLIVIEAGERYFYEDIPRLVGRLSRADLVCGCRRHGRLIKTLRAVSQFPRSLLLGRLVHDPSCLFWVARREALARLELAPGMRRYLPWLVTMRGFRVCQLHVAHRWHAASPQLSDAWPNPADLLTVWWQSRRARPRIATQLRSQPQRDLHGRVLRIDPPQRPGGRVESPEVRVES